MKKALWLLVAGITFTGAQAGPAKAGVMIDRVVAVVNDNVITMSELQREVANRAVDKLADLKGKEREAVSARLNKEVLNVLVERNLQLDLARKRGISVSAEEVNAGIEDVKKKNGFDDAAMADALAARGLTLEEYRKILRDEIVVNKLVQREVRSRITVTESEIAAHYKENQEVFSTQPSASVKHVLVSVSGDAADDMKKEVKRGAEEIVAKLRRGDDFTGVLSDYAKSALSVSGSDLGSIKKGDLISDLDRPAFSLKVGEVSEPLLMADGYHIIKVVERSEAQVKSLAEVKDQISKLLFNRKSEDQYYKWLRELRANAFVEIKLNE